MGGVAFVLTTASSQTGTPKRDASSLAIFRYRLRLPCDRGWYGDNAIEGPVQSSDELLSGVDERGESCAVAAILEPIHEFADFRVLRIEAWN